MAGALWAPLLAVCHWILGAVESAWIITAGSLLGLYSLFIVREMRSQVAAAHWLVFQLWAIVASVSCFSGGMKSPALPWLSVVPMAAAFLAGRRAARFWALMSLLCVVGMYAGLRLGVGFGNTLSERGNHIVLLVSLSSLVTLVLMLSFIAETMNRLATAGLKEAKEVAEEEAESKGRLLSAMCHEIRASMEGIMGAGSLLESTSLSAEQHRFLKLSQTSSQNLLSLADGFLSLSKVETGRTQLDVGRFGLRRLVKDCMQVATIDAKQKGLELSCSIGKSVPAWVAGDSQKLSQVMGHLLSNAVKYTRKGSIKVIVRHPRDEDLRSAGFVEFLVKDSGPGVAEHHKSQLFEPFFHREESNGCRSGLGLGLAMSRELVTLMGGKIGVDSVFGEGSTFWFRVRLTESAAPTEDLSWRTQSIAAIEEKRPGEPSRVLLVEDDPCHREIASQMLVTLGCRVELASNGKEAVAAAENRFFDLILMDCRMPRMDGFAACKHIRELPQHLKTPIVALTANTMKGEESRCRAAGMNDHVPKPVRWKAINDVVEQWCPLPESSDLTEAQPDAMRHELENGLENAEDPEAAGVSDDLSVSADGQAQKTEEQPKREEEQSNESEQASRPEGRIALKGSRYGSSRAV